MSHMLEPRWPSFFRPGAPPHDAVPAEGRAFRLVRQIPPSPRDFEATLEESPEREPELSEDNVINACGASFHVNLAASCRTRSRYKGFRNSRIAMGELHPDMGKKKLTGQLDHLTVWFYVGATPHLSICVDAEGI